MSKITYPTKTTGDTFSAAEANQIKTVVNVNDDELKSVAALVQYSKNGTLPVSSVSALQAFGDSITAGYLLSSPYDPYAKVLAARIGLGFGGDITQAVSGSGVFTAAKNANANMINGGRLKTLMAGLNDSKFFSVDRTASKIKTCIRSFIARNFLYFGTNAGGDGNGETGYFVKTGTWTGLDTTSIGGKGIDAGFSASSVVSGSSIQLTLPLFTDTVVIGTFTDDGQVANYLGDFDVFVDEELYMTYSPRNKNDGARTDLSSSAQGRMPDCIVIKGVTASVIRVVTKSTTQTIIDYIGGFNSVQKCDPLLISLIPKCTSDGYALLGGTASSANCDILDQAIKEVVSEFAGFPVALVDVNSLYNPINTFDGVHPNPAGHLQMANAFASNIIGGLSIYIDPNVDQYINGVRVGKGAGNQTKTTVVGREAGGTGDENVIVGYQAAKNLGAGTGNTIIGEEALGNGTGGSRNVLLGQSH